MNYAQNRVIAALMVIAIAIGWIQLRPSPVITSGLRRSLLSWLLQLSGWVSLASFKFVLPSPNSFPLDRYYLPFFLKFLAASFMASTAA
jgi:hypothetical protein